MPRPDWQEEAFAFDYIPFGSSIIEYLEVHSFPLDCASEIQVLVLLSKAELEQGALRTLMQTMQGNKANPKSQCMGLNLICSGYPMSGSKGPHHGPIFIIDTYNIYCIILYTLVTLASSNSWMLEGFRKASRTRQKTMASAPSWPQPPYFCSALAPSGAIARSSHLHQSFQSKAGTAAGKPRHAQTVSVQRMFCVKYCNVYTSLYFVYCMIQKSRKRVEGVEGC